MAASSSIETNKISFGTVGFGCMGMTAFYGEPMSPEAAMALLQEVGKTSPKVYFDTAEIYKTGNPMEDNEADIYNETMLAPYFASVPRESFAVGTKFMPGKYGGACDYETVKGALQRSLTRLGLSYVDVYWCHRIPSLEKGVEFAASCKRLIDEGLVRNCGLSEICGSWLREAHKACPIWAVQQEWSLLTRSLETELVPVCAELGVGIVAYSPLARNLLAMSTEAAKPTDWRASLPRYSEENFKANAAIAAEISAMSESKGGVTSAQLSLAWLLKKAPALGVQVLPIPGSTKVTNVQANTAAASITLTDEEAAALETIASKVVGERGPEWYMSSSIESQQQAAPASGP